MSEQNPLFFAGFRRARIHTACSVLLPKVYSEYELSETGGGEGIRQNLNRGMPNSDIKIYNFELKKKCSASSCSSRSHSLVRLEGFMGFICEWFSLRFPAEQQPLREQSIVLITPAEGKNRHEKFIFRSILDWILKGGGRVLEEISNYFRSVVLRDGFCVTNSQSSVC